jgi:hypothetical protein
VTAPEPGAEIETTRYGFKYGAATVTRLTDHNGYVAIRVEGTGGNGVDVHVSPTGRSVRVFKDGRVLRAAKMRELRPEPKGGKQS